MPKKFRLVEVMSVCTKCGGRGIIPFHHITNKRNSKQCPVCKGAGEAKRTIEVEY